MTKKKAHTSKNNETAVKSDKNHGHSKSKTKHEVLTGTSGIILEKTKTNSDNIEKNVEIVLKPDLKTQVVTEIENTESQIDPKVKPKFDLTSKQLNILIAVVAVLLVISGAVAFYFLKQPDGAKGDSGNLNQTNASTTDESKDSKILKTNTALITDGEIKSIQDLAITPDFPGLKEFSLVLNKGSALPIGQLDLNKRDGFIGGTEVTLASELDSLGKRMALVQSVALYSEESAQKLKIKDYIQDGFTKQECSDVGDECALFYRAPLSKNTTVDTQRIYFRKKGFVFYFEFAKSDLHPEFDVNWLKKVSNDLANKVK